MSAQAARATSAGDDRPTFIHILPSSMQRGARSRVRFVIIASPARGQPAPGFASDGSIPLLSARRTWQNGGSNYLAGGRLQETRTLTMTRKRCGRSWRAGDALLTGMLLSISLLGCQTQFAHTPYVMQREGAARIYDELPPEQGPRGMKMFAATDRAPEEPMDKGPIYCSGRSPPLFFGEATVALEPSRSWDELVALSTTEKRDQDFVLKVTATQQFGSIAPL